MKSISHIFAAALLGFTLANAGAEQMNYQGFLTDSSGNALADGQQTLTFSLYDEATGGNLLWGPFILDGGGGVGHAPKASLAGGRFNVVLGPEDTAGRPLAEAFGGSTFLGIKVGTNPEISPRQQVLAAPEALTARRLSGAIRSFTDSMPENQRSHRLFFDELASNDNYGFSFLYAGDSTQTFSDGSSFSLPTNTFYILRHDDKAAGDIALSIDRDSGLIDVPAKIKTGDLEVTEDILAKNLEVTGNLTFNGNLTPNSLSVAGNISTSGGAVGIGTTSPSADLHISSDDSVNLLLEADASNGAEDIHPSLTFSQDGGATTADLGYFGNSSTNDFSIRTNGERRITIENGDVGIGTPNPDSRLHIYREVSDTAGQAEGDADASMIKLTSNYTDAKGDEVAQNTWDILIDSDDLQDRDDHDLLFRLNGETKGWVEAGTTSPGGFSVSSDQRLKQDIARLEGCLDKTMALKPSRYRWRSNPEAGTSIGFIAQEVEQVVPEIVCESDGHLGLDYSAFTIVTVGAIQELKAEKDGEIGALKKENEGLRRRLEALEKAISAQQ